MTVNKEDREALAMANRAEQRAAEDARRWEAAMRRKENRQAKRQYRMERERQGLVLMARVLLCILAGLAMIALAMLEQVEIWVAVVGILLCALIAAYQADSYKKGRWW